MPRCTGSAYPCLQLGRPWISGHPPEILLSHGSHAPSPIRRSCRESYRGSKLRWPSLPDSPLALTGLRASRSSGAKGARVRRARLQTLSQILNPRHQVRSLPDGHYPKLPLARLVNRFSFQISPPPLGAALHSQPPAAQGPKLLRSPTELPTWAPAGLAAPRMIVRCPQRMEAAAKTSLAPRV